MKYAQIKASKIVNIIQLIDAAQEPFFLAGYDALVNVGALDPMPGIGWTYDAGTGVFTAPTKAMPSLPQAKGLKALEGKDALSTYFNSRYPLEERLNIMGLYASAFIGGKHAERLAYLQPFVDWRDSILTAFAAEVVALQALPTLPEVMAKHWDFTHFDATNPNISVLAAILITT